MASGNTLEYVIEAQSNARAGLEEFQAAVRQATRSLGTFNQQAQAAAASTTRTYQAAGEGAKRAQQARFAFGYIRQGAQEATGHTGRLQAVAGRTGQVFAAGFAAAGRSVLGFVGSALTGVLRTGLGLALNAVSSLAGGFLNLAAGAVSAIGSIVSSITHLVGSLASSLLGAVRSAFGTLASYARVAALAVAGITVAVANVGVSTNVGIRGAITSLTNLWKNAALARDVVAQLRKEALTSNFDFEDLRDYTPQLARFGFTAREALPWLRAIGDVASAGGSPDKEKFSRIITALGQV